MRGHKFQLHNESPIRLGKQDVIVRLQHPTSDDLMLVQESSLYLSMLSNDKIKRP